MVLHDPKQKPNQKTPQRVHYSAVKDNCKGLCLFLKGSFSWASAVKMVYGDKLQLRLMSLLLHLCFFATSLICVFVVIWDEL